MAGDQFDKRWYILGGFAVLAVVIVGIIVVSRSGGGSSSDGSKTTAAAEEGTCKKVAQPNPREESLPKPKLTTKKGEKVTAVVETNCGTFEIALATPEAPTIATSLPYLAQEGSY